MNVFYNLAINILIINNLPYGGGVIHIFKLKIKNSKL